MGSRATGPQPITDQESLTSEAKRPSWVSDLTSEERRPFTRHGEFGVHKQRGLPALP